MSGMVTKKSLLSGLIIDPKWVKQNPKEAAGIAGAAALTFLTMGAAAPALGAAAGGAAAGGAGAAGAAGAGLIGGGTAAAGMGAAASAGAPALASSLMGGTSGLGALGGASLGTAETAGLLGLPALTGATGSAFGGGAGLGAMTSGAAPSMSTGLLSKFKTKVPDLARGLMQMDGQEQQQQQPMQPPPPRPVDTPDYATAFAADLERRKRQMMELYGMQS